MTGPVTDLLQQLDLAWRSAGVVRADREAMARDLEPDLADAAADGRDPRSLLTPDLPTFARQVADERGVERVPPSLGAAVVGAVGGAAVAFVVGWLPATALVALLLDLLPTPVVLDGPEDLALGAVAWSPLALACLAGALVGLRLALRASGRVRGTLVRAAPLLALGGLVGTGLAVGVGQRSGYSTSPAVVLLEGLLVLGAVALAALTARRSALQGALD